MTEIHPQIRCYLPLTAELVQELAEQGSMAGDLVAFMVTESVRRSDPSGDEDSWEYAALQDAAAHCQDVGQPIVVAAADVSRDTIDDASPSGSRVIVHGPVVAPRVASLHVGDDVMGVDSTTSQGPAVIELSWFDATELADVRALL